MSANSCGMAAGDRKLKQVRLVSKQGSLEIRAWVPRIRDRMYPAGVFLGPFRAIVLASSSCPSSSL